METTIAEETQATGIGGDISTDVAGTLGTQVQREEVLSLSEILVSGLKDDTGIGD